MVERKPNTKVPSSPSLELSFEEELLKEFNQPQGIIDDPEEFINLIPDWLEELVRLRKIEKFFHGITENYAAGDWNDIDAADFQDLMEEYSITEKRFPEPGSQEAADWGTDEELHYIKEEFLKHEN